ncbi:MAG: RHS repeat domain-containing protein [Salibacteraceae bacterium]
MKSLLLILLGSLWSYHLEALQLCLSSQLNPQNQQEIKAEKNYSGLIGGQAYTLSFDVNSINSSVVVLVDDGNSLQSINMVQTGNYTFNLQPVGTNALLIVQSISSKKQPSSICLDNLQLASESQQVAAMVYKEPVNNYRYAFQGQEKDDEFKMGIGNNYAYTYRMHDPRIGRFLSIDPLAQKFPFYSTYAFSGNRVIDAFELEGMEPVKGDPNFGRNLAFVSRDLINSVAPEQRDESNENWLGFVPNTLGDVYKTMKAVKKESKLRPQNVVLLFH